MTMDSPAKMLKKLLADCGHPVELDDDALLSVVQDVVLNALNAIDAKGDAKAKTDFISALAEAALEAQEKNARRIASTALYFYSSLEHDDEPKKFRLDFINYRFHFKYCHTLEEGLTWLLVIQHGDESLETAAKRGTFTYSDFCDAYGDEFENNKLLELIRLIFRSCMLLDDGPELLAEIEARIHQFGDFVAHTLKH